MYDLTIIGAGWAGFNAALRARELGFKTCLIEASEIGGTCLNKGCIPTKTLIQSAKVFALTRKSEIFGLEPMTPEINFAKVRERKDSLIRQLAKGMQFMLKGIDFINSRAEILSEEEIKIADKVIKTRFIIIASGSRPAELPGYRFDGIKILSSDDILNLKEIPRSLLIVGGGVIGCEFASLFSLFGSSVRIIEKMPHLLPGEDKEIARKIESLFKKRGIEVNIDTDITGVALKEYDSVLICVGRQPNTEGLGLERLGIILDKNRIAIDDCFRTNIANIYAAGDCTGKTMLAHFASFQGRAAVERIVNGRAQLGFNASFAAVPNCIFTDPEVASVGMSQEKAQENNIDVDVHKFDFLGLGMARILDEAEGFIKIISDKKSNQILGASIIGPKATELISIMALSVSAGLKVSQVRSTIFAHPTLSEAIYEALK